MEPFIGQIMLFGGNFAPRGWALCDGQLLSIVQNQALFSIIGTSYGGDGRTTFGLPDLRGRVPMHPGNGPGLTPRRLGEKSGEENILLNISQIPAHNHSATGTIQAKNGQADASNPGGTVAATLNKNTEGYAQKANTTMKAGAVDVTVNNSGGGLPHNNVQPYQCINYIIALQGIYPSRG
ncbi:phage tail protein [Maribellus comscasis]|uniref:Phage tail protein n=1 Tax=Maribellus comscasis TaxID=2681766 RepID=A0A6I6K2B7_9BACT|nr:tail fiber protein [Maribellus comscasis]QGY45663.1 phage tail protein [Maribellus comscasis]